MNIAVDTAQLGGGRALGSAIETPCPCCGAGGATVLYRVPSIPLHSCILLPMVSDARAFPRRDLELAFCNSCGFVFNHIFDEAAMHYSTDFEESQHFSGTFTSFARGLAKEIDAKCGIDEQQLVLEIGCGKGEFLFELCSISNATGVGVDPGYRADEGRPRAENVRFIVDHYGPKYKDIRADVVLCRHTLEHIPNVDEFIGLIREVVGPDDCTSIVFETPDARRVLSEAAFWDIYYEHCSYFSLGTHARLFRRQRFDVTDLLLVYDGQYIGQYAKPAAAATEPRLPQEDDLDAMRQLAATFPARVLQLQDAWRDRIRTAAKNGKTVVLWGGGSKAVSFLTTLGLTDEVIAVVDVNPYKQGKFVPGTGHAVLAPSALKDIKPDLVVVMNPIYVREIGAELAQMGLSPEILPL